MPPLKPSNTVDPNGFESYVNCPQNHPNVLGFNNEFVIVRDIYPKATVHLLIIPRDPIKMLQHPFVAFRDEVFLSKCKEEALKWRTVAAEMLKDIICPPELLRPNDDWRSEIRVGIHSAPSMDHLHIHVISRDFHSNFLRLKTNYTAFTTVFFVELERFPLTSVEEGECEHDPRRREMICWRCGSTFKKFDSLKTHLEEEFVAWKNDLMIADRTIS